MRKKRGSKCGEDETNFSETPLSFFRPDLPVNDVHQLMEQKFNE